MVLNCEVVKRVCFNGSMGLSYKLMRGFACFFTLGAGFM